MILIHLNRTGWTFRWHSLLWHYVLCVRKPSLKIYPLRPKKSSTLHVDVMMMMIHWSNVLFKISVKSWLQWCVCVHHWVNLCAWPSQELPDLSCISSVYYDICPFLRSWRFLRRSIVHSNIGAIVFSWDYEASWGGLSCIFTSVASSFLGIMKLLREAHNAF